MKKVFFTLACLTLTFCGYAQFNQGTVLLSGETGLGIAAMSVKAKDGGNSVKLGNETTISFSPSAGYFVIDNLAVGASLDLSTHKSKDDSDNSEYTSNTFSFGPFARYYITKGLFGEAQITFGSNKDKYDDSDGTDEDKASLFGWSLGAGYAIMISDQVAFEPSVGYGSVALKPDGGSGKLVTSGILVNVGVTVYLGKK
jgi:outer membrane protein